MGQSDPVATVLPCSVAEDGLPADIGNGIEFYLSSPLPF